MLAWLSRETLVAPILAFCESSLLDLATMGPIHSAHRLFWGRPPAGAICLPERKGKGYCVQPNPIFGPRKRGNLQLRYPMGAGDLEELLDTPGSLSLSGHGPSAGTRDWGKTLEPAPLGLEMPNIILRWPGMP